MGEGEDIESIVREVRRLVDELRELKVRSVVLFGSRAGDHL